jgi:hypothetical protein
MVAGHLQKFESLNSSNVIADYADDATVTWTGIALLTGSYRGAPNIATFYTSLLLMFLNLTITNETTHTTFLRGDASVNASFYVHGYIPSRYSSCGRTTSFNGTVQAQLTLAPRADSWMILDETWFFVPPFSIGDCMG